MMSYLSYLNLTIQALRIKVTLAIQTLKSFKIKIYKLISQNKMMIQGNYKRVHIGFKYRLEMLRTNKNRVILNPNPVRKK